MIKHDTHLASNNLSTLDNGTVRFPNCKLKHPMASQWYHKSTGTILIFDGNTATFVKYHMNYYPMIVQSFNISTKFFPMMPLLCDSGVWIFVMIKSMYYIDINIQLLCHFSEIFILTFKKDINELFLMLLLFIWFCFVLFCFMCKIILQ